MPPPSSTRRAGRRLLSQGVRPQVRGIVAGVVAGLVWTLAKVAVPSLARVAIDRGIIDGDGRALLIWSLAIVGMGCIAAVGTGLRRYQAFSIAWRAETD